MCDHPLYFELSDGCEIFSLGSFYTPVRCVCELRYSCLLAKALIDFIVSRSRSRIVIWHCFRVVWILVQFASTSAHSWVTPWKLWISFNSWRCDILTKFFHLIGDNPAVTVSCIHLLLRLFLRQVTAKNCLDLAEALAIWAEDVHVLLCCLFCWVGILVWRSHMVGTKADWLMLGTFSGPTTHLPKRWLSRRTYSLILTIQIGLALSNTTFLWGSCGCYAASEPLSWVWCWSSYMAAVSIHLLLSLHRVGQSASLQSCAFHQRSQVLNSFNMLLVIRSDWL